MRMHKFALLFTVFAVLACSGGGGGGGGEGDDDEGGGGGSVTTTGSYRVFAWNDLGMHCANPDFTSAVILPPYNTIWAQVVKRGNPPQVVKTGITVEYRILNNTTSQKTATEPWPADWTTFWDNSEVLFGEALELDKGLNLKTPTTHNGLSGQMALYTDHYEAVGVPVTPLLDDGTWEPFQVAEITVKDGDGATIAQTRATVPVSDDINCSKCHGDNGFISSHNDANHTDLPTNEPFLCSECHASPALGGMTRIDGKPYLSEAIHKFHGNLAAGDRPECYDCHPGATTKCNRSLRHTSENGNCTTCHGSLLNVGQSITDGRVPWVTEPRCSDCHNGSLVPQVFTGDTLYRDAKGHGGLSCAACHQSPHAMVPSREASDNYQALQYQGKAVTIGSCKVCHSSSKGEGSSEFAEEHGSGGRSSACNICHTAVSGNTANWPHQFKWSAR